MSCAELFNMRIQPYRKISDLSATLSDARLLQSPGFVSRLEPATGLNVPGISVNGEFILVENFTVFQHQDIKMKWYAGQGGPRAGIADFGKKYITGEISFPLVVDRNARLLSGIRAILDNAQLPTKALRIDTNHALSHVSLTAEDGGTDNNQLLTFDSCLITELSITAEADGFVKVTAQVMGTIESRTASNLVLPPADDRLVRAITWADCDASRMQSAMRTVAKITVTIKNESETGVFLVPYDKQNDTSSLPGARHDQIDYLGIKQCEWSGDYEEMLRRGLSTEDFMHGGWMVGENLVLSFGPLDAIFQVPVFVPAEQPLGPKWLRRTTRFFAQISPEVKNVQGGLFIYPEDIL